MGVDFGFGDDPVEKGLGRVVNMEGERSAVGFGYTGKAIRFPFSIISPIIPAPVKHLMWNGP